MKKTFITLFILLSLFSCTSTQPKNNTNYLQSLIDETCVEVLIKRTTQDSLTYEKELPWDLIPYNIRNDEYHSIGTAFAISENTLVTAAHVLFLFDNSIFYDELYIRHKDGFVQKIEQLHSFHNSRDFAVFSISERPFERYLNIAESYDINDPVYSVGNIYGQGIVAIPGTLLGTLPESENGEWENIKTAPPNDKGSSGGPLLDKDYNVISVIVAKDNNFSHSLPLSEMNKVEPNKGIIHRRFKYQLDLAFGLNSDIINYDDELTLPKPLKEVKNTVNSNYVAAYKGYMDTFLESVSSEIFPNGESSEEALQSATTSNVLQLFYRKEDDKTWYASNLETKKSKLKDNGSIIYSDVINARFINLVKPDSISYDELYSEPKVIMDLILEGINTPRTFANQKIRILSMGVPYKEYELFDNYERKWNVAIWHIEYSDEVGILFYTPTPDGLVGILKYTNYYEQQEWEYDLKKWVNFVYIPYYGELKQWKEFLGAKDSLYGFLKNIELDYTENSHLSLKSDYVDISFDNSMYKITDKMRLSLFHDFYKVKDEVKWGLRKVIVSEYTSNNYFVSYRFITPPESLKDRYEKGWNNFITEQHPYNEVSYTEEGRTNIGAVHPQFKDSSSYAYSLYLGCEGNVEASEMEHKLNSLKELIIFKDVE